MNAYAMSDTKGKLVSAKGQRPQIAHTIVASRSSMGGARCSPFYSAQQATCADMSEMHG